MRFQCPNPPRWLQDNFDGKFDWRPWFAWHPVCLETGECAWLETVERSGYFSFGWGGGSMWIYSYRKR